MESMFASVERERSVSSIRRMNWPPWWRAKSQLKRAVRAPPTCRCPVGLGAKRTLTGVANAVCVIALSVRYLTWRGALAPLQTLTTVAVEGAWTPLQTSPSRGVHRARFHSGGARTPRSHAGTRGISRSAPGFPGRDERGGLGGPVRGPP